MRYTKLSSASVGVGSSLIIVIFVVLCLTVFSVLSFEIAYSDLRLSTKSEEMIADYYLINGKGEEKLAEISEKLMNININIKEPNLLNDNFKKTIIENLKDIDDIKVFEELDYVIVKYEINGQKNQKLCIKIKVSYYEESPYYEIISWNLTNIDIPDYDEDIYDLWKGFDEEIEN